MWYGYTGARRQDRAPASRGVFIVDDEPKICSRLKRFFELQGWEAMATTSGREALAVIQAQRPDDVLLDIQMPEMSGLEVLERLKASNPDRTFR